MTDSLNSDSGWDAAASLRLHDAFGGIEEESNAFLDISLQPRGPEMLYDVVAGFGFGPGARALDVGCGEGRHTRELGRRFGFETIGVDPSTRQLRLATEELARETASAPALQGLVTFARGSAQNLPVDSSSIDVVWCRDVLVLVPDVVRALIEIRRVLKPDGRALLYQMYATDLLEPREAAWLLPTMGCVPGNLRRETFEAAVARSGLRVVQHLDLGPEWGEYGQEQTGKGAQKLLRAARLIRGGQRYVEKFGAQNYDIALGDCLWHVYRLIGKLSDSVYVLAPDDAPNQRA